MNEEIKEPTISARIRLLNYEADKIENYITNLQQENERLVAESTHYESKYYNEAEKVDKAIELIEKLLKEEFEVTDDDSLDYGKKMQRAYFSDAELGRIEKTLQGSDKE